MVIVVLLLKNWSTELVSVVGWVNTESEVMKDVIGGALDALVLVGLVISLVVVLT